MITDIKVYLDMVQVLFSESKILDFIYFIFIFIYFLVLDLELELV